MGPTLDDLASPEYRNQLYELHDTQAWALGGIEYVEEITHLAGKVGARSILNYGSGRVDLSMALSVPVVNYDPGVPGLDVLPQPADVVVCTDVLEHVEPDRVQAVLRHIYDLTNQVALLAIATRPAEKRLPDGRNAHLTIDNAPWWHQQVKKQGPWTVLVRKVTWAEIIMWARK